MADYTSAVAFKNLTLQTTPPVLTSIKIGSGTGTLSSLSTTVTFVPGVTPVPEGYQVKIWGDVDTSDNASIQATEATSTWFDYAEVVNVKLAAGDGSKTVYAKLRDDVYNESSAVSASASIDMTAPIVAIISGPIPNKISKVPGKNTSQIIFQVSEAFTEYKVCVVADSSISAAAATAIPTTNGSINTSGSNPSGFAADTSITVTINGADLEAASAGDGEKCVKIFVADSAGNWSN